MEPKQNSPEHFPNMPPSSPEFQTGPERGIEQQPERSVEQQVERAPEQHHATTTAAPGPIALPIPVAGQSDDTNLAAPADDNPPVAADEDLIEKEWVEKAKKIIADTKDDPATREKEVGKLQTDYLRKRYGKELGQS